MDTDAFLRHLQQQDWYRGQIAHVERIPARTAAYGPLAHPLHPELKRSLETIGQWPLYCHQAAAIDAALDGQHVIIATPAASGKSLSYHLPVLHALLEDKHGRALYLYPTKALAQDQLRKLDALTAALPQRIDYATYDGDTPDNRRGAIRRSSQVLLSNPDMLHLGILPNHKLWSRVLARLRYVVLDEAHIYRGVFGSHVGEVLRRLRRLCALYGAQPQFILASATIANPGEHAQRLIGLPCAVVHEDASPSGGKDFVLWDPPVIDEAKMTRRSASTEATALFTELVRQQVRTLAFARTRKLAELIFIYARQRLQSSDALLARRIKPYRAGYLAEDRRQIERELFEGHLLGLSTTNALELGIDIGDLDATVLVGYPGSIASTWQQAGRSGRAGERSLSILVGVDNPLDQYLMRNPQALFGKPVEHALTALENPHILRPHLLCAAYEAPLTERDIAYFGAGLAAHMEALEREGLLRKRLQRWFPTPLAGYPAERVAIRSTSPDSYVVVEEESGALLETVDSAVAFLQIHPGAIHLHQGDSYLITKLDLDTRTAYAKRATEPYYTQAMEYTDIRILEETARKDAGGTRVYLGTVDVERTVVGYKRKKQFTEEVIAEESLDLPSEPFQTVALWWDIPPMTLKAIAKEKLDLAGALHAAEHAAIGVLPLFALCDRNDIGGVSTPLHPDTGQPQVFIYDGHPGGIGISEKGFELVRELWEATLSVVSDCPCPSGCPSCIQSPKCGNNNEPLDKQAAVLLLRGLLGRG